MVVVRDGRVVHHELDPGARGQGRAGVRHRHLRRRRRARRCSAPRRDASRDAFTVLHDAFLAGGAFVQVPRRRRGRGPDPGAALVRRRRPRVVPAHARRRSARTPRPRCSTASARPETDHLVDAVTELLVGDNAHLRYLSVQEHGARTWHLGLQRAHRRVATRRCSTSAVALGGDYARLRSESLLHGRGRRERPARGVLRRRHADARLPHAPGPRRAATRAATCCSRARSRTPPGRCTRASSASAARRRRRRTRSRPTATSCSPRARARSRSRTSRSRPTT